MTKIITIGQTEMIRVGRDYPCPICGKPDWCLVFADQTKAVCARKIDLDKPQFGSAGTIYDLDPKKAKEVTFEPSWKSQPLASISTLHKVNSLVIDVLGLTKEHVEHLTSAERGFSVETIALRGYASSTKQTRQKQVDTTVSHPATIWEKLFVANGLPKDAWRGVPGFYWNENAKCPIFESKDGILIPCRNSWGQIVGFQVRLDNVRYQAKVNEAFQEGRNARTAKVFQNDDGSFDWYVFAKGSSHELASGTTKETSVKLRSGLELTFKKGQKYVFVSSAYKPEGTSAKSFPHFAYSDVILEQARFSDEGKAKVNLMSKVDNLLVTEGLLKGDITASVAKNTRLSQLGSICVISMAGVAAWRPISDFIGKTELKKVKPIYLAFDQDFEDNDSVFERMYDMVQDLVTKQSCTVRALIWPHEKGIDDFLLKASPEVKIKFKTYNKQDMV